VRARGSEDGDQAAAGQTEQLAAVPGEDVAGGPRKLAQRGGGLVK